MVVVVVVIEICLVKFFFVEWFFVKGVEMVILDWFFYLILVFVVRISKVLKLNFC